MAVNAYDIQVCLWKMLKLSSKTCVDVSMNHPYVSSSLLCLLLLYICFPLVFWILIYSLPLVVSTCIILSVSFSLRRGRKYREDGEKEVNEDDYSARTKFEASDNNCGDDGRRKKSCSRVHSVRRRRAREIMREEEAQQNVEEKNAVSSTDFNCDDMVDKKALIEESPKEIREVEVDFSLVNNDKETASPPSPSLKHENEEGCNQRGRLQLILKDEEEANKDDQRNVMDVGVLDAERNKRLESLIARRRSRKLLSLQVRRSLMNMDRNDHFGGQISSLIIPKINTSGSPSKLGGPFSPGPGSAPSILIPMRNPFDLPYDPHEEKPDLTGDSFHQEFTSVNSRDMVFCRHESFSLGPSLPGEIFQNQEETSSVRDFGFRQRGSQFSKPKNESDRGFEPIMEQESYETSESKSNIDSPDDDQIKEVIQVYENVADQNHGEESGGEVETRLIQREDFSSSSNSASSSEEDDQPIFKIDREAILKSLSMRRNSYQEIGNNEQIKEDNLSYANSALENASRLKQEYYADKPTRRHIKSCSIASDMQVEVSEVSSPPLTIEENMSNQDEDVSTCDGEMERNIPWEGEDLWAGSSHVSEVDDNESRSTQANKFNEQDTSNDGRTKIFEDTALSYSMEEPLSEKHCIHPCPSIAFGDNGDEILQNENEHQIKQLVTVESNSGMDQLAAESKKSSDDSDETVEVSRIVENHVSIEPVPHSEAEQSSGEATISLVEYQVNTELIHHSEGQQISGEASISLVEDHVNAETIQHSEGQQSYGETSISLAEDHVNTEPVQHSEGQQISGEASMSLAEDHVNNELIQHSESQQSSGEASTDLVQDNVETEPIQHSEGDKSSGEASISLVEDHVNAEPVQHSEGEQSSGEAITNRVAMDSDGPEEPSVMPNVAVEHVSPKSVLQQSFSVLNFDHDTDEEIQHSGAHTAEASSPVALQTSTPLIELSRDLPSSDENAEVSKESYEPAVTFTIEAEDTESVNEKMKIQENDEQPKEVAGSRSQVLEVYEATAQPREETSSKFFISTDEIFSNDFGAANPTVFSENVDQTDNSVPISESAEEKSKQHQETLIREATHNDSAKSISYEDQTVNSALCEGTEHEGRTHSTTSNSVDGTKVEIQEFGTDETLPALSGVVENNDNSESCKKDEADRKAEQCANTHEAVPETISTLDNETK